MTDLRSRDTKEIAGVEGHDSDPSQLVLPEVDTELEWFGDRSFDDIILYVPSVILFATAGFYLIGGDVLTAMLFAVTGSAAGAAARLFEATSDWYTSPRELFIDWIHYRRLRHSMPWGAEETIDDTHGIRRVAADGSMIMRDGRRVAHVVVNGTNTDRLAPSEAGRLVNQLTSSIDEDIRDKPWAYYSTSRKASMAEVADRRGDRAENAAEHGLTDVQEAVIWDSSEWLRDDDEAWDANEWIHGVEVEVRPGEVGETSVEATIRSVLPFLSEEAATGDDAAPRKDAAELLSERVDMVTNALAGIDGVTGRRADPAELVDRAMMYWTDGAHDPSETLLESFERGAVRGYTRAERMFGAGYFDVRGKTIEVGNRYARTLWISEWPVAPSELFLRDLFSEEGVDLDVKVYANPRTQRAVKEDIQISGAEIDAKGEDLAEATDMSALTIDDDLDAYVLADSLLKHTNTQPWEISGFVTIRAESRRELDSADETVRRRLEATPADCLPVADGTRQRAAFAACAPFARNVYREEKTHDRSHLAFGGALGAMFPFGQPDLSEEDGMRWGRNTMTGNTVMASPFSRGTAPHMITIGASRSGKTYGISTALAEWWLDRDDRTLIVCDTQGGFDGLTKLCDGDHIVIDGSSGINPLDIRPAPEDVLKATGGGYDGFRLKVDEATEFFCGILRSQGVDPSDYRSTIEEALEETYREAGITADPSSHGRDSPTPGDFIDQLGEMLDDADAHTFTGHSMEVEITEHRVADLLDRLSGFREGGKYSHMLGEDRSGLDPDTRMAYLDLRQLRRQTGTDQSVTLHLMLSQVSQLIKQTPGDTIFCIDEAHQLLHSDEMVEWLQEAAREWARFDAAIHFVSQSPQEFVRRSKSTSAGQENQRQTIVEQCSTIQVFRSPQTNASALAEFGLNDAQVKIAQEKLTPGKAGKGHSTCLISFQDQRGWIETCVEAPPALHRVLTWPPSAFDVSFEDFVFGDFVIPADLLADDDRDHGLYEPAFPAHVFDSPGEVTD